MNIEEFEKNQTNNHVSHEDSFAVDETASIKQKIKERKSKQKKLKLILGAGIFVIVILLSLVAYSQYKLYILTQEEKKVETVSNSTPKTGEEVVKALSRHILVPQGNPQIAEVQDAAKLRDTQAFFKDVETGDIVVVYESTIFVYRPSKDIVVASGDISGTGQLKP
jgi:hypothetical protein